MAKISHLNSLWSISFLILHAIFFFLLSSAAIKLCETVLHMTVMQYILYFNLEYSIALKMPTNDRAELQSMIIYTYQYTQKLPNRSINNTETQY